MRILLDTHILLWTAAGSPRLPASARDLIADSATEPVFSTASLWEIAIKQGLRRADFQVDARTLRQGLLDNGYAELAVLGVHAVAVATLPPLHKDPFDRLLLAQAIVENLTLLTADATLACYPGPVRLA